MPYTELNRAEYIFPILQKPLPVSNDLKIQYRLYWFFDVIWQKITNTQQNSPLNLLYKVLYTGEIYKNVINSFLSADKNRQTYPNDIVAGGNGQAHHARTIDRHDAVSDAELAAALRRASVQ